MYERPPDKEELAAFGLRPEDYANEAVEVWPENWQAFELFSFMQTQWRIGGMGSATGLDYGVLFKKMDRMGLSADQYDQLEDDIRVMEFEAISVMNEKS